MPYDFRPYVRATQPAGGKPGRGVFLVTQTYMYPDHGNIICPSVPERGLGELNQPFADAYQGMEIWTRVMRMMWKQARALEIMQNAIAKKA